MDEYLTRELGPNRAVTITSADIDAIEAGGTVFITSEGRAIAQVVATDEHAGRRFREEFLAQIDKHVGELVRRLRQPPPAHAETSAPLGDPNTSSK